MDRHNTCSKQKEQWTLGVTTSACNLWWLYRSDAELKPCPEAFSFLIALAVLEARLQLIRMSLNCATAAMEGRCECRAVFPDCATRSPCCISTTCRCYMYRLCWELCFVMCSDHVRGRPSQSASSYVRGSTSCAGARHISNRRALSIVWSTRACMHKRTTHNHVYTSFYTLARSMR